MQRNSRPFGFNLIGHASANAGVGVATREVAHAILDAGYPLAILDIDPGHGRTGHDLTYSEYFVEDASKLPYAINISVLSIVGIQYFVLDRPELFTDNQLNVGYLWWELSTIPEIWKRSLEIFDVLLAGSDFLYSTYSQAVDNVFHVKIEHSLPLPTNIMGDRPRFGIPNGEFVFICILEPTSDPIRKNPFSAIEAFQGAFPSEQGVRLLVKINNANAFPPGDQCLVLLRRIVEDDPRIVLFTESLSYADTLTLYASCDAYVALHRSEGLGFGIMEAMSLCKPVIVTSWSGNMSFTDHTNTCLVRYRLVPVDGSIHVYSNAFLGQDARWAEPNIQDASAWMRKLASRPDICRRIGSAAHQSISTYLAPKANPRWLDELRAIWEQELPASDAVCRKDKFARLKSCLATFGKSPWQRGLNNTREVLDRHLLWRFKRGRELDLKSKRS